MVCPADSTTHSPDGASDEGEGSLSAGATEVEVESEFLGAIRFFSEL